MREWYPRPHLHDVHASSLTYTSRTCRTSHVLVSLLDHGQNKPATTTMVGKALRCPFSSGHQFNCRSHSTAVAATGDRQRFVTVSRTNERTNERTTNERTNEQNGTYQKSGIPVSGYYYLSLHSWFYVSLYGNYHISAPSADWEKGAFCPPPRKPLLSLDLSLPRPHSHAHSITQSDSLSDTVKHSQTLQKSVNQSVDYAVVRG